MPTFIAIYTWIKSTRCFAKSKQTQFREYKQKFINLSDEEKRQRAQDLWKIIRVKVRSSFNFASLQQIENFQEFDIGDIMDDDQLLNQVEWF